MQENMEHEQNIENELTRLEIRGLQEQVTALEGRVLELEKFLADCLFLEFAQRKTESGELAFPRIEELRHVIGDLLGSRQAKSLEAAYAMAEKILGEHKQ